MYDVDLIEHYLVVDFDLCDGLLDLKCNEL